MPITQHHYALSGRRYGSFAGKGAPVVVTNGCACISGSLRCEAELTLSLRYEATLSVELVAEAVLEAEECLCLS